MLSIKRVAGKGIHLLQLGWPSIGHDPSKLEEGTLYLAVLSVTWWKKVIIST
jgi:hypothetical protein